MTPIPLQLPLKASEAAALADLIYLQVDPHPLTGDSRRRFATRIPALGLETLNPYPGSLQRDPIHAATWYIAVDAGNTEPKQPLLLRIAPAAAPASGLFPAALLIGRLRLSSGAEVVINAIPFGPTDHDAIRTFAEHVDRDFLRFPIEGIWAAIRAGNRHLPKS
ncbi:MAG TPA: hypothetical protein VGP79_14040 [Bryobacteraceae bacterium]|nr:hypothetical protein [Bryobacteraceae bacterium]